jgi:uncharacterized membrane protein
MQTWIAAAFASALFAGIVSILAKCGIKTTDSDVATALRTCVVVVFTWVMVAVVGSFGQIGAITPTSWLFLVLSGLATGGSWICYFKALSVGDVNKVVPIDKSSTLMAVVISIVLFAETNDLALKLVGTAIATAGTFLMIEKKKAAVGKAAPTTAAEKSDQAEKAMFSAAKIDAGGMVDTAGEGSATRDTSSRAAGGASAAEPSRDRAWLAYALAAAVFAALTSVLAKVGIEGVESNLATAIRTCVVLVMAWAIVIGKGKLPLVKQTKRSELGFLAASGVATGASWLFYYYAIQTGVVSVVVQIDKLSLLVSVAFAWLVFKERLTRKSAIGLVLIVAGTALVALCR